MTARRSLFVLLFALAFLVVSLAHVEEVRSGDSNDRGNGGSGNNVLFGTRKQQQHQHQQQQQLRHDGSSRKAKKHRKTSRTPPPVIAEMVKEEEEEEGEEEGEAEEDLKEVVDSLMKADSPHRKDVLTEGRYLDAQQEEEKDQV